MQQSSVDNNYTTAIPNAVEEMINLNYSSDEEKDASDGGRNRICLRKRRTGNEKKKTSSKIISGKSEINRRIKGNKLLCCLVKKHPCLYDSKSPNYLIDCEVDKAWSEIGKTLRESEGTCKNRWRNIRAAFFRSVNLYKTKSGPNRSKQYYLYDDLKFLENTVYHKENKVKRVLRGGKRRDCEVDPNNNENKIADPVNNNAGDDDNFEGENLSEAMYEAINPEVTPANPACHSSVCNQTAESLVPLVPRTPYYMEFMRAIIENLLIMNSRQDHSFKKKMYNNLHEIFNHSQDCVTGLDFFEIQNDRQAASGDLERHNQRISTSRSILVAISPDFDSLPKAKGNEEFLLTVIECLKKMNPKQELLFKEKTYADLIDVLDDPRDFPVPQHSSSPAGISQASCLASTYHHLNNNESSPSSRRCPNNLTSDSVVNHFNNNSSVCQPILIKEENEIYS